MSVTVPPSDIQDGRATDPELGAPWTGWRHPLAVPAGVVALGMVAFVLLWGPGLRQWYWIDEALSVGVAGHHLTGIPGLLRIDGSPPLWYLVLAVWTRFAGDSPAATHLLSLGIAALCVPVGWWAGRRLGGRRTAVFATVLTTTSPFLGYFARETRMYTLVVLFSLLVPVLFLRWFLDGDRRAGTGFTVALVALLYTHNWGLYTGIAAVVALGPVLVSLPATARRDVLRRAAWTFGIVAVAYLPWLPMLLGQVRHTGAPWSFTPSARDLVRELAALVHDERVLLLLILGAGSGLVPLLRTRWSRDLTSAVVLTTFAFVPVAIGWGLSHAEPSWATRYLAVVVGPLVLLAALGLSRAGGTGTAGLVMVALLLVQPMTRLDGGMRRPSDEKSNAPAVAAAIRPLLHPGDLVVLAQPEAVPLAAYYFGRDLAYADPTGVVDDPTVMDWRDAEDRLRAADPDGALGEAVDGLRPGQRVVLLRPADKARATDTEWITLVRTDAVEIATELRQRPDLRAVASYKRKPHSFISLRAEVYEVVAPG